MQTLTNFDKEKLQQYKKAVKIANLYEGNRFRIEGKAFDSDGALIPNYHSLLVTSPDDCSKFWEVYDECQN